LHHRHVLAARRRRSIFPTMQFHAWWIIIAAAVFMLIAPLAYLLSRGDGQSR